MVDQKAGKCVGGRPQSNKLTRWSPCASLVRVWKYSNFTIFKQYSNVVMNVRFGEVEVTAQL
ncbi:MAG TPA: hypothetical protein P5282_08085 [Anaerolineaceae bacterium]|nr:hypothetical protein [Anaerolineaceae bacterium]